jgi:hypothetical protein
MPAPVYPTYTSQRSLLRALVLSTGVQASIAEAMTDAQLTYTALMETSNFAQIETEFESDYQYAGKATSFATDARLTALKSSMELSTRVDQFLAGWLLSLMMGQDTVTGAASPYSHVMTFLESAGPADVTNLYIEDSQGLKRRFIDMALSNLVLSGAEKGAITAKGTFMGSGRYADGAIAAGVPARITHPQFLYGSDAVISLGPQGAPVSFFPRVMSWEATFDRAIEECRVPGGGLYAAFLRYGNPTLKLKMVIAVDSTTDIRDYQINQTPLEIKIAIASGAASLTLDYPYVILPKADLSEQQKYVAYTLELDQNSILKPGGGAPVTATIVNTTAAYLVSE